MAALEAAAQTTASRRTGRAWCPFQVCTVAVRGSTRCTALRRNLVLAATGYCVSMVVGSLEGLAPPLPTSMRRGLAALRHWKAHRQHTVVVGRRDAVGVEAVTQGQLATIGAEEPLTGQPLRRILRTRQAVRRQRQCVVVGGDVDRTWVHAGQVCGPKRSGRRPCRDPWHEQRTASGSGLSTQQAASQSVDIPERIRTKHSNHHHVFVGTPR